MGRPARSRRKLLEGLGTTAVVGLAGCATSRPPADSHTDSDHPRSTDGDGGPGRTSDSSWSTSRGTFDELDEQFHRDGGLLGETNDSDGTTTSGLLAWGESLVMQTYVLMYRTYRDEAYLDAFVDHADAVLESRDIVRGVTDYRGESLPGWRADSPYTIGRTLLADSAGRPTLEVRSAVSPADEAVVGIGDGPQPGTFELGVHNWALGRTTHYDNLSMNPEGSNYAVTRINGQPIREETPNSCRVTVEDVRDSPVAAGRPASGEYELRSPHYVYAVHTGMITTPLVDFAGLVSETPALRKDARYGERADRYLEAAESAVRIHDDQWRETDQGEGYYVSAPGSPNFNESADLPLNQSLALGRTLVGLATLTDDGGYAEKARKLARTFSNDLRDGGDAYVWSYFWTKGDVASGWSPEDPVSEYRPSAPGVDDPVSENPEHIRYGFLDTDFAVRVHRELDGGERPAFVTADMERFARTYAENVVFEEGDVPAARRYVDGTGPTTGNHQQMTAAWNGLSPWNEGVLEHTRGLYDERRDEFELWVDKLFGVAMLNYWNQSR